MLPLKTVLDLTEQRIVESVHFIESGIASMVSTLEDGARIEVGMVVSQKAWYGLPVLLERRARLLGKPWYKEFMSTMLGIRRPGVTLAIGALQRAGLVRHV